MFSSNVVKIGFVVILFALLCNACSFWQSADNENTSTAPVPVVDAEVKSEIPFSTKEPDVYQAEIVVATGASEEKMFAARNGNYRRYDFTFSDNSPISLVHDAVGGKQFINHQKKIYAEDNFSGQVALASPAENWDDFLTADLLNQKSNVKFEKIDAENNLTKYRIVSNETNAAGSETIISIDEKLGFPVKSEFYGFEGDQKILKFSVEMKNVKLLVEDSVFQIPVDYRKVSIEDFRTILDKENFNEE
ncbi:MAG: hypothetical protein H0U96_07435 [Acidobacteria bacterium]|jgi:hypothetical protein|nr:hypothetical protein [Acidobacteriota bacterium]